MKTRIVRVSRTALTLAMMASPATVLAGGWFGQRDDCARSAYGPCARQEYTQAFQRARQLDRLSCGALAAYAESNRVAMNERIWATIRQPLVGPGAASSTAPLPSIEAPFTPPPSPPAEPGRPGFAPEKPKADTEPKPAKESVPNAPK